MEMELSNCAPASRLSLLWKSFRTEFRASRSVLSDLPMKLKLFAVYRLMLSSSVQEFILFAMSVILCCHMAKTVLFCTKAVMGYLAEVRMYYICNCSWL